MFARITLSVALSALLFSAIPALASAQAPASPPQDRVVFGGDVHVRPGEVVNDAVAFGGDVRVEGEVLGDAVAFGGDLSVLPPGTVRGDRVVFGGRALSSEGPSAIATHLTGLEAAASPIARAFGYVGKKVASHALLFVLGLLLLGLARERVGAMQTTLVRDPIRTAGFGILGYLAAAGGILLLALTIVGIPVAIVLALALPLVTYVGLAVVATLLGAALPITALKDRPIAQLGAGTVILCLFSLVPLAGDVLLVIAACAGLGAAIRTRFGVEPPSDLPAPSGPYRTAPA